MFVFDSAAVITLSQNSRFRKIQTTALPTLSYMDGVGVAVVVGLALMIGSRTVFALATDNTPQIADPNSWLNQRLPLMDELTGGDELSKGPWVLLFYHYNCTECLKVLPRYLECGEASYKTAHQCQLAFVSIPPLAPESQDPLKGSSGLQHFALPAKYLWLGVTPTAIVLQDGFVVRTVTGDQTLAVLPNCPASQLPSKEPAQESYLSSSLETRLSGGTSPW